MRYGQIAGLIIGYPLVPLLILYITWGVIKLRYARRSSVGFLDGMFAVMHRRPDSSRRLCGVRFRLARRMERDDIPELRRAAKRVVLLMPPTWLGLFAFALWDPFVCLSISSIFKRVGAGIRDTWGAPRFLVQCKRETL